MLTKHRTVMRYRHTGKKLVEFRVQEDVGEKPSDMETVEISLDVWHEMNMPETITMSIEPGDHLNDTDS